MKKLIAVMVAMALLGPGCLGLQVDLTEKGLSLNFSAVTPEAIQKKTGVEIVDD